MPQDHWSADRRGHQQRVYEQGYLAHLILRDRLKAMQPEQVFAPRAFDFQQATRMLDIACGAGHRAVTLAREYTRLEVTGLEKHPGLLIYAGTLAEVQGLENCHFFALQRPWLADLLPDYYDLVRISEPGSFLQSEEWAEFLVRCQEITRPGGSLYLTQSEHGMTNSPALEKLGQMCQQGLYKLGKSETDEWYTGMVPHLFSLLCQNGWQDLQRGVLVSDYLMGDDMPSDPALRRAIIEHEWEPLIVDQGIASAAEFDHLLQNAEEECGREHFCGIRYTFVLTGKKPEPG